MSAVSPLHQASPEIVFLAGYCAGRLSVIHKGSKFGIRLTVDRGHFPIVRLLERILYDFVVVPDLKFKTSSKTKRHIELWGESALDFLRAIEPFINLIKGSDEIKPALGLPSSLTLERETISMPWEE